jgi:MFS transporter, DHA1 family, inner membrane transport protein
MPLRLEPRRVTASASRVAKQSMGLGIGAWVGGLLLGAGPNGEILNYGTNGWIAVALTVFGIIWIGFVRPAKAAMMSPKIIAESVVNETGI